MSLIRFILFFIIFYILFRAIKAVLKYLTISKNNPDINNIRNNKQSNFNKKYKDVEDAEFTEIESEPNSRND